MQLTLKLLVTRGFRFKRESFTPQEIIAFLSTQFTQWNSFYFFVQIIQQNQLWRRSMNLLELHILVFWNVFVNKLSHFRKSIQRTTRTALQKKNVIFPGCVDNYCYLHLFLLWLLHCYYLRYILSIASM